MAIRVSAKLTQSTAAIRKTLECYNSSAAPSNTGCRLPKQIKEEDAFDPDGPVFACLINDLKVHYIYLFLDYIDHAFTCAVKRNYAETIVASRYRTVPV